MSLAPVPPPGRPSAPEPHPGQPAVPEPPPGPGVQPPFVAPPTDGSRRRRGLAIGLAGTAVLVLCAGGLLGLGGLVVFGSQMIVDSSRAAVTEHLSAVRDGDYAAAYEQLCDRRREELSEEEFRQSLADDPPIEGFTVGEPEITDRIVVPTTVEYEDGSSDTVRYLLEQDTSTGDFEVCGSEG